MNTLNLPKQHYNLSSKTLIDMALQRREGVESGGTLVVNTGKRTGRSPNDKFIVKDVVTEHTVDWGEINRPIEAAKFSALWDMAVDYLSNKSEAHFASQLRVGADKRLGVSVNVITETAWHQLFARHLFIEPEANEPKPDPASTWTIINVPGFLTDPARDGTNSDGCVMLDFSARKVLICGMRYAGEMKKAMFTVLNFVLPEKDVLPMHCAANVDADGGNVALFFGLSGTGKTTLSSDPERYLIGDDEHGWSTQGVFNFEGGCYAKCINLTKEREPVIYNAIRDGAIMENVVLDAATHLPNFDDASLTQNTRAAYPLDHVELRVENSMGGTPRAVILLTCDLYGVLPPVALLTTEQAAYYFLSGYTALVGSTEVGAGTGIKPTFSACFGAPFFPRSPGVYGELLIKRLKQTGARAYLVNTGWIGGGYGSGGERISIAVTRRIVHAIVQGELEGADATNLPGFNISIPATISGVDSVVLNPANAWQDKATYKSNLATLIEKFLNNFKQFDVKPEIRKAGPQLIES